MDNAWFDELDKYPNLRSKELPWFVGCAKQVNTRESEMAFDGFRPKIFKIIKVTWVRARKPPYCIWRVEYNLDSHALLGEEGDELKNNFKMLESHHPPNTAIINIQRSTNVVVDYGVFCDCFDGSKSKASEQLYTENRILKELGIAAVDTIEKMDEEIEYKDNKMNVLEKELKDVNHYDEDKINNLLNKQPIIRYVDRQRAKRRLSNTLSINNK